MPVELTHLNPLQIIVLIIGLSIAWVIFRIVLRLAKKVFETGCAILLFIGLILVVYNALH